MNSDLPATGTAALLELLDPFVPDDFINEGWPGRRTGGRRREYSAAQLYRIHLLALLTPVHAVNLLVKMLPEQRGWLWTMYRYPLIFCGCLSGVTAIALSLSSRLSRAILSPPNDL